MAHSSIAARLCALVLASVSFAGEAAPVVRFSVDDVGGGQFRYNLNVDNSTGSGDISGLLVMNGNSLFGLDNSSEIVPPENVGGNPAANWSFLAPGSFLDILFYFSLDPAADIPMGGSLGGFSFLSMLDPSAVMSGGFAVEVIDSISGNEIPLQNAQFMDEPSGLLLVALGLVGLFGSRSLRPAGSAQFALTRA